MCVDLVADMSDKIPLQTLTSALETLDPLVTGVPAYPSAAHIEANYAKRLHYFTLAEMDAIFLKTADAATDLWLT